MFTGWVFCQDSQDHPQVSQFTRRTQKLNSQSQFTALKRHKAKSANGKRHVGWSLEETKHKLPTVLSQWCHRTHLDSSTNELWQHMRSFVREAHVSLGTYSFGGEGLVTEAPVPQKESRLHFSQKLLRQARTVFCTSTKHAGHSYQNRPRASWEPAKCQLLKQAFLGNMQGLRNSWLLS